MSSSLTLKLIRSLDELEPYSEAWDNLVNRRPEHLPMDSHAWITTFLECRISPADNWCCMLAYEGSQLMGVLPLIIRKHKWAGIIRSELSNPRDAHTRSVSLAVAQERENEVIELFLSSLNEVTPDWRSIYFERIPVSSPLIKHLDNHSRGILKYHELFQKGAFIDTTGDYNDFRTAMKKSLRGNLKTHANRLKAYDNVHYEFLEKENAKPEYLERFMNVEVSNWKGKAGSAIIQSPEVVEFYTRLVNRLAKRGWLEWHFLAAEGKTIAAGLAIRCGGNLVLWKSGYDEDYSRSSPSSLLLEQIIIRAFESDNINKIEFISDPIWSYDWPIEIRDFHNLWIYPARPVPFVANILPKRIKSKLRQIPILRQAVQRVRALLKNTDS
jgi:hypothetical protein